MKYKLTATNTYKRELRKISKQNKNLSLLNAVIAKLGNGEELPEQCHDHALSGNWKGHRECHIQRDWLLIYRIYEDQLVLALVRTGTHSDLFNK